jgi:hypothetical protein
MHLNSKYVRSGEIDPRKLLNTTDVSDDVLKAGDKVGSALKKMVAVAGQRKPPTVDIGPQCTSPYECPLKEDCWKPVPQHSVFTLTRLGMKAFDWYHDGNIKLRDLPDDVSLNAKQAIQVRCVRSKRPHIDRKAIRAFLDTLEYPLYFLDFETINLAIPAWDQTSPYQQVPFQFSLHILKQPGGKPEHRSFLADGPTDPRREILALLKRYLGQKGSIVAYNATFEKAALRASSEVCPAFAPWWNQTEARVVDLLKPFRDFHYYHPNQCGSASIKVVLPAITGKGYEDMEIADGGTASSEFARITFGDVSAAERKKVRGALEKYCALDTEGMVRIVEKLSEFAAT